MARVMMWGVAFASAGAGSGGWFDSGGGAFQVPASQGAFLYAGVATFAAGAKIRPPPADQGVGLNAPVTEREWPAFYIFSGPIRAVPGGPFGKRADSLGTSFALRAIRAQPLDYLRAASRSFWESFLLPPSTNAGTLVQRVWAQAQNGYMFPVVSPRPPPPYALPAFSEYDPAGPGLRVVQPYAGWVRAYQRYIVVPGPLLGVIILVGLGAVVAAWRRFGCPAPLPWLLRPCPPANPAAILEFHPRHPRLAPPPSVVAPSYS